MDTLQDTRNTALAVFARAPIAGQVKSRLAQEIGAAEACELYAAMLRDTLALTQQALPRLHALRFLAHTPDDAFFLLEGASLRPFWNGPRLPQGEGDLGARMLRCLNRLRTQGAHRALIIGSDAPDLPLAALLDAFAALKKRDMVFGPSDDGGFYLIGASRPLPADFFDGVEWSAPDTLRRVLRQAEHHGMTFDLLQPWRDVDDLDDLHALRARLQANDDTQIAFFTRTWLQANRV